MINRECARDDGEERKAMDARICLAIVTISLLVAMIIAGIMHKRKDPIYAKMKRWKESGKDMYTRAYPLVGNDLYWHAFRLGIIDDKVLAKASNEIAMSSAHHTWNKKHLLKKKPEDYLRMSPQDAAMHMQGFRCGSHDDFDYRITTTSKHISNPKAKRKRRIVYCQYMTEYGQVMYTQPQTITARQSRHLDTYNLRIMYNRENPAEYIVL